MCPRAEFVLPKVLMRALRADDRADEAALPAQLFAVEYPVDQTPAESEHGGGQRDRHRILQPHRVYRLILQPLDRGCEFRRRGDSDQESVDLMRRQRAYDVAERILPAIPLDPETVLQRIDCGHPP